jgi:predicted ArsR family transcriptional regulator
MTDLDAIRKEFEKYLTAEYYVPPRQSGDMNAHEIAILLNISQQHVKKTLEPAIASGKIIFIKAAREEDGRVNPVWRMGKV